MHQSQGPQTPVKPAKRLTWNSIEASKAAGFDWPPTLAELPKMVDKLAEISVLNRYAHPYFKPLATYVQLAAEIVKPTDLDGPSENSEVWGHLESIGQQCFDLRLAWADGDGPNVAVAGKELRAISEKLALCIEQPEEWLSERAEKQVFRKACGFKTNRQFDHAHKGALKRISAKQFRAKLSRFTLDDVKRIQAAIASAKKTKK